jgi:hypothetical protein
MIASLFRFTLGALALGPTLVFAQTRDAAPEPPVPIVEAGGASPALVPTAGEQRLYQPGRTLVPPEDARQVVGAFAEAYAALGSPRLVIYVNRELVDTSAALRLTRRNELVRETTTNMSSTHAAPAPAAGAVPATQVNVAVGGGLTPGATVGHTGPGETRGTTREVTADQSYEAGERAAPTLADRQTVRDLERLFGRPLRVGGARLADARVVASMLDDRPLDDLLAAAQEPARKDREALGKVADAVVEILISTRSITLPGWSGNETRTVPDLQATLIRLSDGAILAQAAATDVLGRDRDAGRIVRQYDVRDIAEATALALMEDLTLSAPPAAP